jgi:hypothetical protein
MKSNEQPLFRVVKNEFVWKAQQKKDGTCERRETSVCLLAESPFRILHFTTTFLFKEANLFNFVFD